MSVIDDLKAARAEIEKGWHQGSYEDADGNVYILGACNRVHPAFTLRNEDMLGTLTKHVPDGGLLAHYNDDPSTTKQDVLNLFDKALADLGGFVE